MNWQVEAITNILKNCVEHSNNNTKIQVNYEENQVYSKIEIRDYGVGIYKEDLPHIFALLLTISYRNSQINEKFTEVQSLKKELSALEKEN